MKSYIVFVQCALSLAIAAPSAPAQMKELTTAVLRGKSGAHRYQMRFVTGPFRKDEHQTSGTGDEDDPAYIDGKPEWKPKVKADNRTLEDYRNWFGTDGGFPAWEFKSFEVRVNGRDWNVPPRLWRDCYEGGFRKYGNEDKNYWVVLAPDGKRLVLGMKGSDGAGSYYVVWYLRADGRHSREVRGQEQGGNGEFNSFPVKIVA